jgi:hypothetical protein
LVSRLFEEGTREGFEFEINLILKILSHLQTENTLFYFPVVLRGTFALVDLVAAGTTL